MEKINNVNFSLYRIGESFEFNRIAASKFAKCAEEIFRPLAEKHQTALTQFDTVFVRKNFTIESKKLETLDFQRDNSVYMFLSLIARSINCGVASREEAARRLDSIFDNYENIAKLPYMQENGLVENLLQDLSTPESLADIATIGATLWYDDLKKQNEDFMELFNSRNEEEGEIVTGVTKEARLATEEAYKNCVQCLNTLILIHGFEPYAGIAGALNNLIERQKSIIKTRKTKNKPDDDNNV